MKHVINIKINHKIFYILFHLLNLQNPVYWYILYQQHISIQTSHISRALYPHVTSVYRTELCNSSHVLKIPPSLITLLESYKFETGIQMYRSSRPTKIQKHI